MGIFGHICPLVYITDNPQPVVENTTSTNSIWIFNISDRTAALIEDWLSGHLGFTFWDKIFEIWVKERGTWRIREVREKFLPPHAARFSTLATVAREQPVAAWTWDHDMPRARSERGVF